MLPRPAALACGVRRSLSLASCCCCLAGGSSTAICDILQAHAPPERRKRLGSRHLILAHPLPDSRSRLSGFRRWGTVGTLRAGEPSAAEWPLPLAHRVANV